MTSIIKKVKKGKVYYYAAKSARVNGKPRIVWQKYLGTVDDMIVRAQDNVASKPKEVEIFQAGGVAALLGIANRIKLVEIIDQIVPKRTQAPSVGEYILLATLNRALAPCSKLQMPDWYHKTVLRRLWRYDGSCFTSQRFWDHMDCISDDMIDKIQEGLAARIKAEFKLNPGCLLYDTTNFFTYIATGNKRNTIAKRGRSKAKRHDLRQVGLALLVSSDFQIPLFHRAYEGNRADRGIFPEICSSMKESYKTAFGAISDTTIVFDKGNVAEDALSDIVLSGQHFVCAIPKNTVLEQFEANIDTLKPVEGIPGTKASSFELELGSITYKALLTYSESNFTAQLADITDRLQNSQKALNDFSKELLSQTKKQRPGNGMRTLETVRRRVKDIVSGVYVKNIMRTNVELVEGTFHISYDIDQDRLDHLIKHDLGRTMLLTSRRDWSEREVISAYRGLNRIEGAFKAMKMDDRLHWQPMHHWTDQKIKVHALYCVLALLLASLAHKIVSEAGIDVSLPKMLNELNDIREVALFYSKELSENRTPPIVLSKMTPVQKRLADLFEIGEVLKG